MIASWTEIKRRESMGSLGGRVRRPSVFLLGLAVLCGTASVASAQLCGTDGIDFTGECVDLTLVPSAPEVEVGDIFTVELVAKSVNGIDQPILNVEAVLDWDPTLVKLLGNEHDCAADESATICFTCGQVEIGGPSGYNWVSSTFPKDNGVDRLNADCGPDTYCSTFTGLPFNDGTAWYQASAQWFCGLTIAPRPVAPDVDPLKGSLLVTRFIFEALAPGPAQITMAPDGACLLRQKICQRGDPARIGELCDTDSFCGVRGCTGGANGAVCVGAICVGGANDGGNCPGGDSECPGDLCSSAGECPGGLCLPLCTACSPQFCCTIGVDNCDVCSYADSRVISGTTFGPVVTGSLGAPADVTIFRCEPPTVVVDSSRYLNVTPPPGPDPVAIEILGVSPTVACLSKYVQSDGQLGAVPIYKTPAEWQSAMTDLRNDPTDPTVHVRGHDLFGGETYSARLDCAPANPGTNLSDAISGTLWKHGDVDHNDVIDITDILRILSGFSNNFHSLACTSDADCAGLAPHFYCDPSQGQCLLITFENVDIKGVVNCWPDRDIGISDALGAIWAFQSLADNCTTFCP